MAEQDKKYRFVKAKGPGKTKTYYKSEEELTDDEMNLLYQEFANMWDFQPLINKNRFIQWMIKEGEKSQKNFKN